MSNGCGRIISVWCRNIGSSGNICYAQPDRSLKATFLHLIISLLTRWAKHNLLYTCYAIQNIQVHGIYSPTVVCTGCPGFYFGLNECNIRVSNYWLFYKNSVPKEYLILTYWCTWNDRTRRIGIFEISLKWPQSTDRMMELLYGVVIERIFSGS